MNDVFISYRRHKGEAWAELIKELLEKKHVKVFLDKHKHKTEDFALTLKKNINHSNNFLLILSEDVFEEREGEEDWVIEEIKLAREQKKNIIAVMFNGYNPSGIDWDKKPEELHFLKTFECLKYDDTNMNLRDASILSIIQYMIDDIGNPWAYKLSENSEWYGDQISEADRLWMTQSEKVCRSGDLYAFSKLMKDEVFSEKTRINYMCFLAYDIPSLKKKTIPDNINSKLEKDVKVYGTCHGYSLVEANATFGENHFIRTGSEAQTEALFRELLNKNNLEYFDVIDFTLALKDFKKPQDILRIAVKYLNPDGGAIFIRDLDDDLVVSYPDKEEYIRHLIYLLELDPGAGNRHYGKTLYTDLHRVGADRVFMLDGDVTTANIRSRNQTDICDAYFSYLLPEYEQLVNDYPENDDYKAGLFWLRRHYDEIKNLFSSKEYYFRAGFISGYGIFIDK